MTAFYRDTWACIRREGVSWYSFCAQSERDIDMVLLYTDCSVHRLSHYTVCSVRRMILIEDMSNTLHLLQCAQSERGDGIPKLSVYRVREDMACIPMLTVLCTEWERRWHSYTDCMCAESERGYGIPTLTVVCTDWERIYGILTVVSTKWKRRLWWYYLWWVSWLPMVSPSLS